ncbi:MAG: hypothetical protein HFG53_15820 [Lachnospiraceae bacterium]|nr:hypothetical protein [Lachnospiraceae bacterium]
MAVLIISACRCWLLPELGECWLLPELGECWLLLGLGERWERHGLGRCPGQSELPPLILALEELKPPDRRQNHGYYIQRPHTNPV